MEIEKAKLLLQLDEQKELPLSQPADESEEEDGVFRLCLLGCLVNLYAKDCRGLVSKKRIFQAIAKNPLVESFTFSKDLNEPSILKTTFGETKILSLCTMFKHNKLPHFIKPNNCYYNCNLALQMNEATKQITGKVNFDKALLHSVLVLGDDKYVVDFNSCVIMKYDFYMKLTQFETLNIITKEEFLEEYQEDYYKIYSDYLKQKGETLDYGVIALSHNEIVEKAKQLKHNPNVTV